MFMGHFGQFGLGFDSAAVRAQLISVGVVERDQCVFVFAPRAWLAGRCPVILRCPQQMRMRIQMLAGPRGDQHQAPQRRPPLQLVIDNPPWCQRIRNILRLSKLRAHRRRLTPNTCRPGPARITATSRNSHPTTVDPTPHPAKSDKRPTPPSPDPVNLKRPDYRPRRHLAGTAVQCWFGLLFSVRVWHRASTCTKRRHRGARPFPIGPPH